MPKTACIVDASPTIRVVLEINLASAGFAVRACADGPTLLAWLTSTKIVPDLLLLDIDPPVNSLLLLPQIQQVTNGHCTSLLLSTNTPDDAQQREWTMRGLHFLQKPFTIEDLLALITTLKVPINS
jgi:DNA-binding response OmpR family regulator